MTQATLTTNHPGFQPHGRSAPLTPMPLGQLLGRIRHEWENRKRIFDLPTARFWRPDPDLDLGFDFLGRRCATPVGPAAGPHSQLAENIVLSWLGGARLFELKTVQILDDLEIKRPCIDMQTIGYNIEWSQELTVPQSLTEYVKASMLLRILSQWEPLQSFIGPDPGPYVFDMSVGYDLAGISSAKVASFIEGMRDATAEIEALRTELTGPWAGFADLEFDSHLADTLTLSTFHGCPPDEIEAITKHLIDEHDLDVIVKLNPTLLGFETVARIVNDELGYTDVSVKEEAFAADLQFDRGVELIGELDEYARAKGRRFGIKLTNTLVVDNTKQWMPDDPMYLSGPPLHVLAMTLLARLRPHLPDGLLVSFSAGITKENLADSLAVGVSPTTICSDLLKPGGYGRLAPMLRDLAKTVAADGHRSLENWRAAHPLTAAEYSNRIRSDGAYRADAHAKLPREVDNELEMFGCVACNFCITVCPNDAFFNIASPQEHIEGRQQYFVIAELCNECGNCMTFCPEEGDPAQVKPKIYTDRSVFEARADQGFLISDGRVVSARADDASVRTVEELLESGSPLS